MIRAVTETASKLARLRSLLTDRGLPGIVLTRPASVAWLTGGMTNVIDRSAGRDAVWIAVGHDAGACITTTVEGPRLRAEKALPFELVEVPWQEPDAYRRAADEVVGPAAPDDDALDTELTGLRLALVPEERARLMALGADATTAVEDAVRAWRPGATDRNVMADVAAGCERAGIVPVCLIVGGDERLARFRHPLACGTPTWRQMMAVLVAMRDGLHVALTRHASAGPPSPELAGAQATARRIESIVLHACTVRPSTYGDVLQALATGYGDDRWREHWQGGPIGYRQREFEIAPEPADTPWHAEPVATHHAIAFNPSVAGGGKAEDTFLIGDDGLVPVTAGEGWPTVLVAGRARPAILEVDG
jgi:Xaa-Pro aminopeptidase